MLFFRRGRHQQHVFGRGGVVAHLTGWYALGLHVVFMELCPEKLKIEFSRKSLLGLKSYLHRLHSKAGGGLKGAHRGLEQLSQEAGI